MILIVEDDADLAETCALLVASHGYAVDIARNGVEALRKITRRMPELIVSDCQMPQMDGIQLCAAIRALGVEPAVPIILMSGTEHYRDQRQLDYDAFLKKPFRAEQLMRTIQALLNPLFRHPQGRSGNGGVSIH